ncbi:MAG TPA: 16S rRNA (cytidine(1402)-2'-O)-methyltransferase [Gammaproteobacteria bacterium]|nr:16S rRNA (cytidine(1402)-2'-O)-methyltransferase [Gammaproteobacteria bacterium]
MSESESGRSAERAGLYVVATPIGNLGDFSVRAQEVLRGVELIAAEDTRVSGRLLAHFGIRTPLIALHEHNERERSEDLLARLREGAAIALISDAGTPLISDPGLPLVRAARAAGIAVYAVPGPCAFVAALSVSGLPTDRFVFEGFLPSRAAARRRRLTELAAEPRTLIFYEAPHRIVDTLTDMADVFGATREAAISRELTKLHETVHAGPLGDLIAPAQAETRGEWVVVVAGRAQPPSASADIERTLEILAAELPLKQAAALTAKLTGAAKNDVYALGLRKKR